MKKIQTEDAKTIKYLRSRVSSLSTDGNALYNKIFGRRFKLMFTVKADQLSRGYVLSALYERVQTAQTLGWDTIVVADDEGLHFKFAERLPSTRPNF